MASMKQIRPVVIACLPSVRQAMRVARTSLEEGNTMTGFDERLPVISPPGAEGA
jgi:hypothetical protein